MSIVSIYDRSRLLATFEGPMAWRAAVSAVNRYAAMDGCTESGHWYRTANRDGYQRGEYRATQRTARDRAVSGIK